MLCLGELRVGCQRVQQCQFLDSAVQHCSKQGRHAAPTFTDKMDVEIAAVFKEVQHRKDIVSSLSDERPRQEDSVCPIEVFNPV